LRRYPSDSTYASAVIPTNRRSSRLALTFLTTLRLQQAFIIPTWQAASMVTLPEQRFFWAHFILHWPDIPRRELHSYFHTPTPAKYTREHHCTTDGATSGSFLEGRLAAKVCKPRQRLDGVYRFGYPHPPTSVSHIRGNLPTAAHPRAARHAKHLCACILRAFIYMTYL